MADARGRNRINLEVTEDIYDRVFRLIPRGWRQQLFNQILDQLLTYIEQEGLVVIALIADGRLRLFGRED